MAVSTYARRLVASGSDISSIARHSGVVRITHWLIALSFIALVLSGLAILLAHPRLYWGETGARDGPSLINLPLPFVLDVPIRGPGRYLHFLAAWIAVFTGLIYVVDGLAARHFSRHLLPARSELTWKHLRQVMLDDLRFKRPGEQDSLSYNLLQRITYLLVIFVAFPLAIWTGLAMSPAITSVVPAMATMFGGQQSARTIHFFTACLLVLFFVIHIVMICLAGFKSRVRAMITGHAAKERSEFISRRKLIRSGLAAAAGIAGLDVAARIADHYGFLAPDHNGILGAGEALTYGAQRILISRHSRAREFDRSQISKIIPVNGEPPKTDAYQRLLANGFADWRLTVDGLVARPSAFSLAELRNFPSRSQITHQACEEGWSFIAEWSGVPLSYVLHLVGARLVAKWVVFFTLDDCWDSIDIPEAFHPQTLLVLGMNGQELPTRHGAPMRVRVPRQLGQKSKKYLSRILVTDTVKNIGKGWGANDPEDGYSWYMGI